MASIDSILSYHQFTKYSWVGGDEKRKEQNVHGVGPLETFLKQRMEGLPCALPHGSRKSNGVRTKTRDTEQLTLKLPPSAWRTCTKISICKEHRKT